MTLVLGIETATTQLSVALGDGTGPLTSISLDGDRRHVEVLAPTIAEVCRLAGHEPPAIGAIAVDAGPGLFTGMRVGIATAQGLAVGLGVGVVPVRSVDVLAHPFRHSALPVVVVIDARRGEVFRSIHRGGEVEVDVVCTSPAAVAAEVAVLGPCLLVGDGARRYGAALAGETPGVEIVGGAPSAVSVVELAHRSLGAVDPAEVVPLYLREADATPNFEVAR